MLKQACIAQAFGNAADSYDHSAALQRDVGMALLQTLPQKVLQEKSLGRGGHWLDLGCGTGHFSQNIAAEYAEDLVAMDIAAPMVMMTRSRFKVGCSVSCIQGRAETLPLESESLDVVFSNFVFQWSEDVAEVVAECLRVLKPGGVLVFSVPGEMTLNELRSSWQQVDSFDHVNSFYSKNELATLLSNTMVSLGLSESSVSISKNFRVTQYLNVKALLMDLKNIGANRIKGKQKKGLLGKKRYQALQNAYERYRSDDGFLPATYEILNVRIQKPA